MDAVPVTDGERFTQWRVWLGAIHDDILDLLLSRHIFREVQSIIGANVAIRKGSFYAWMVRTYIDSQVMGVRRHCTGGRDVVSLIRLVNDVRRYAHVLSRDGFVALYMNGGGPDLETLAHGMFDRLVGQGAAQIDPLLVQEDATGLRRATEALSRWATNRVAHLIDMNPTTDPTFRNLDDVLDLMEKILARYLMLLDGRTYHLPEWTYDWRAIFREPWVTEWSGSERSGT